MRFPFSKRSTSEELAPPEVNAAVEEAGHGNGSYRGQPQDKGGYESPLDELLGNAVCPPTTTERKLVACIDLHVVPLLVIMYLLAFLDRINIGNARIFHLVRDLHMRGIDYNVALAIFFVPYCVFEIPSNMLLKRLTPRIWLGSNMFLFGLVTTMQGIVKSYGGLLAARFFLGLFEASMFCGAFYVIGMWYRRHEAQKRFSFFFCSVTLAGAFGGLLAAAIGKMNGIRGYSGWRWIFIIEGCFTVFVSIIFLMLLPDFPEQAKWLTLEEKNFVAARLRLDQGRSAAERTLTLKDVVNVFKDYKVVLGGFMYLGLIVPGYSYAYFSPSIINSYGYGAIQSQLLSVPPWVATFVWAMLMAGLSDCFRHRWAFAVGSSFVSIAGLAILISEHHNRHVQYAGLVLTIMGSFGTLPLQVCWFQMNLGGHHRRAIGTAWQIGFGNTGGIIAIFAFLPQDAPKYVPGYSVCFGFAAITILSSMVYGFACLRQNKKRESQSSDHGLSEGEKMELGDKSPEYRYQL